MASHLIWLLLSFISTLICGVAALILFHLKPRRRTSSSSSCAATCPSDFASPSTSSVDHPEIKYDVFLSFRGTDTRSSFLSHLLTELSRKKIEYFVDDQKLKRGDEISSTLLNAIKKSQISLVVFSKDYADSKWCLEEIEQIIQCRENQNQIVVPIFYEVDPSTVRHQIGSYKDAFEKYGKRFDQHKLQKWKTALHKAANLSGFDSSKYPTEARLIKEIVEHLVTIIDQAEDQTGDHNDLKDFVGIHEHVQCLEARLDTKSQDIFIIGIWGMGGVGKTTIAEILYNRLYNKYEGRYFLRVREELDEKGSIVRLKKDLLSKLLNEEVLHDILRNNIPAYVKRRLSRKKVLVILDDINDANQLKILTGGHKWFGSGSRIVMTSRDKNVFSKECDETYMVQPLDFEQSLQLFEIVLTKDCPDKKHEHCELSKEIVNYAKGVPLAITVLGRYLFNKEKDVWKSKLKKLEKKPDVGLQEVLELSFRGLDDDEHKDIFLYLACFFGTKESKERIIMLLDLCGYHTIDGLKVLQDKALVTITNRNVFMHELIQVMGREIVRKRSPKDLGQRNHLFDVDDVCKVLVNKMGTQSIESIRIGMRKPKKDIQLGPQAFAGMDNLRLLQFDNGFAIYPPKKGFESLPNELRCFIWTGFPSKSFQSRICNEYLVELRLRHSKLQRLWDGVQELPSLKIVDLSWSRELTELPDLSNAPNLKRVCLFKCNELTYVGLWPNHNEFYAGSDCPSNQGRKKVCNEESEKEEHSDLCELSLPILPSFKDYAFLSLQLLNLSYCGSLTELPDNIDFCFPLLQCLALWDTKIETLPASIKNLSQLTELRLSDCSRLRHIPELPPSIENFVATGCISLETLQFTSNSMPLSQQKHKFRIHLYNCIKLDDHVLQAVARHYRLATERIISANLKYAHASLCFPRREVPEWFGRYGTTQGLESVSVELSLHSKMPMGFIFYLSLSHDCSRYYSAIKCRIEFSNVPKARFTYYPKNGLGHRSDRVLFLYESALSRRITKEISRIKAPATTDDLHAKVWFKLFKYQGVKEWGVYPVCNDTDQDDYDGFHHNDDDW